MTTIVGLIVVFGAVRSTVHVSVESIPKGVPMPLTMPEPAAVSVST